MDNLYLARKPLLLVGDMLVNFGDILPGARNKQKQCMLGYAWESLPYIKEGVSFFANMNVQ